MKLLIGPLSRQRYRIRRRIETRRQEIISQGDRLQDRAQAWLGTPRSMVQVFLAGFLLDQARPMVPDGPSPLKFLIPWIMRELG